MITYNDIIKENGFLTKQGEELVSQKFLPAIQEILDAAHSDNETRIIGGILSNLIGKEVSNMIQSQATKKVIQQKIKDGLQQFISSPTIDPFDNSLPEITNTISTRQDIFHKVEEILQENYDQAPKMADTLIFKDSQPEMSSILDQLMGHQLIIKKQ
jgi:hypothetical protein